MTKVHSHKRRHCPWMTKELLNLLHKQKSLHRRIVKSAHKNSELIARHRALRSKTNNLYRRLRNSHFKRGCCSTVRHLVNCGLPSNISQTSKAFLCKLQYHSMIYLVTLNVYYNSLESTLVCPMGPTISTRYKYLCQLPLPKLKVLFHS